MVVGLLAGAEVDIGIEQEYGYEIEISKEYMYSPKTTTIVAPQISPQYSIVHAPQLQFNSPSGTIGGSPITQTPAITGHVIEDMLIPTQTTEQAQAMSQAQAMDQGGGGMMDYILIIAVVAIGAIFILPKLFKKKVKVKTPAGVGGSVS